MVVTFDNPTNVNGLVIVAFKATANAAASVDVSTYMNEIFQVHVNVVGTNPGGFTTGTTSGGGPFPIQIPIITEFTGTTVTLKNVSDPAGTISATLAEATTGIVIGRK